MKIKYLIIVIGIFSLLTLQGCATTSSPIKTDVVYVDKLVSVPAPQPPVISRPTLVIQTLTPTQLTDDGLVVQAYKATVLQLEGYATQLETVIDGYRTKP